MTENVLEPLYSRLIEAERQYEAETHELEGLQVVMQVLRKLNHSRDVKNEQGEDVESLDQLAESTYTRLRRVLRGMQDGTDHAVDFHGWADEIVTDIRQQDPLMLSFDSDEGSNLRQEASNRVPEASQSKGTSDMLAILKSNGRLKEKDHYAQEMENDHIFNLTTLAWSLAVLGMLITVGFLSADFWYAQQNKAIQTEMSEPTPLELPAITLCSGLQDIPTFANYPTEEYPGLPLFAISTYVRSDRVSPTPLLQITYPDTLAFTKNSPIEDVIVSEDTKHCSSVKKGFDVAREMKSLRWISAAGFFQDLPSAGASCLHCFRIAYKRRELLQPYDTLETGAHTPAVHLKILKSKLFDVCQNGITRRNFLVYHLFTSELILFAKKLENRGVLDFNGHGHEVLNQSYREIVGSDYADFYCNVYFFSGFFYPSLDNASISYRYEPNVHEKWVESGQGPYYTAFSWKKDDPLISGPNPDALELDTYDTRSLQVFAEDASTVNTTRDVLPQTRLSLLGSSQGAIFLFKRINRGGKNEFQVKKAGGQSVSYTTGSVDEFFVGFDYEKFETETILTMATMSWPEFVTDVFEFIGLFTGICIFTLIVAPAHSFGFRAAQ